LSQAFDNAPGHLESSNGDNSRVLLGNLDYDWGVSGYDVPVINTTSMVYDLPIGRNRRFGKTMSRALDALIGGYRLTFINRMTSGRPVNLTYTPSALFSVGSDLTYRPNVLGDPVNRSWTPTNYFDRTALAVPTDITQPFGDARRNSVRGPGFWQADVGIHKEFRLRGENTRLELRAEAFNLFNRTNFGAPNGNVSSNAFGTITSAFPAREIQLAVKLYF
jgi:hypothetical protein